MGGGDILRQELHLLRHAALDDGVVLVEPHRQRLAIENVLANLVLHHRLKLGRGRRTMPLRLEIDLHLAQLIHAHDDLLRRFHSRASAVDVGVHRKQQRAENQKVQKRLAQPAQEDRPRRRLALLRNLAGSWFG